MSFKPTSRNKADTQRARLLSRNEDNPSIDIIRKMKLLLYNESIMPLDRVREAQRLLSFIESIFKSGSTGEVFLYLLDRGAATSWLIQVDLEIPEPTAYRALKRLRAMGLVTPEWRIPKEKKSGGGPRPMVWALLDSSKEDVARAVRDHRRALSPNYRVAEEFVQYLIKDFIRDDITKTRMREIARIKLDMSIQRTLDVVELAATILTEKGIKVWR